MPQLMRTANPTLNDRTFRGLPYSMGESMTVQGTVNKTGILLLCSVATAAWTWHLFMQPQTQSEVVPLFWLGTIGGFIFALITSFKMAWAPITAPLYALAEGFALGGISAMFEVRFPGIPMEAVCLTFGTLFVMLLAYKTGMIRVTQRFRLGVIAATGAIFLFYLVEMVLGIFHIHFGAINGSGPLGIGISLIIVVVAALNLVLDFDFIERGAASGAPRYMEWYGGFALMVTLVWLYLEMLRLLTKLQRRD